MERRKVRHYEEGNCLVLEERTPQMAYIMIAVFLFPLLGGSVVAIQEAHPFYAATFPLLLLFLGLLIWFALSWRRVITIERGGQTLIKQSHWFGKTRREYRVAIEGYDEVQYGSGLTANGNAGGRLEYVMLVNGKRECNFLLHQLISRDESEAIAGRVADYTGLPLRAMRWDHDPSFISNIPGYCRFIRRIR